MSAHTTPSRIQRERRTSVETAKQQARGACRLVLPTSAGIGGGAVSVANIGRESVVVVLVVLIEKFGLKTTLTKFKDRRQNSGIHVQVAKIKTQCNLVWQASQAVVVPSRSRRSRPVLSSSSGCSVELEATG